MIALISPNCHLGCRTLSVSKSCHSKIFMTCFLMSEDFWTYIWLSSPSLRPTTANHCSLSTKWSCSNLSNTLQALQLSHSKSTLETCGAARRESRRRWTSWVHLRSGLTNRWPSGILCSYYSNLKSSRYVYNPKKPQGIMIINSRNCNIWYSRMYFKKMSHSQQMMRESKSKANSCLI